MLNAAAAAVLLDELADGAFGSCALQKLDFGLAYLKKSGLHFLVGNFFDGKTFKAENVLVERDSLFQRGNGDTDVFDMGDVHN
jgi:hypothetical protein